MAYIDDVYLVVNIAPVGIPTYVRLSQNENGRRLYFAVTGGEIPSGSTATMSGTKPDGVVYSKAGTISGNTVTFNEDIQLTAVAGEWPAKIVIVNGGQTVMTARIRFVIDADTVAAGAVPSDSQLEGLVAQAAAYAEAAKDGAFYGSPLVASTVAEMTDKTRVYVYTGSESGYTSGNWYYWSGSAWTSGGVYNATAVSTDTTLSVAGKAADAKATGDAIAAVTIPTDKTLTVSDAPADAKVVGDELADLKDDFTSWIYGKSVSIIGDSIDTFDQDGYKISGYNMYYPALGVTDVNQTWWMQVIKASGASLEINASWSDSRVTDTHPSASYPDFYDRVEVIGTPDVIFVTLGTNDSSNNVSLGDYDFVTDYDALSESEFRPAYIKGMKALQSLYPSSTIVAIMEKMSASYVESIEYICSHLGIKCINASDYAGASGVHPGAVGMSQIARLVLFPTDETLNQRHMPADASSVGARVEEVEREIASMMPGLTEAAKVALLDCFQHVAWIDEHGQTYYNALESALYADSYPNITAQFNSGLNVIYTDDTLDSLKQYLTVKYYETEESTGTVIASANYSLSGSLAEGMSTIFVSYSGLTTSFVIDGVVDYYNIRDWSVTNGLLHIVQASTINRQDGNVALSDVGTSTNRRTACATRGKHALINNYTGQETEWYAIPVPNTATRFTVGVQPATQFTGARFWKYNEDTQLYESKQNVGWKQGEFTGNINTTGDEVIVTINTKYDSAGSSYPTLPTNIYISFE